MTANPIVEVEESGDFVVTKKADTGGLVDVGTVTAQLLYELGEPTTYLTPDVVADFTTIQLEQVGKDRVPEEARDVLAELRTRLDGGELGQEGFATSMRLGGTTVRELKRIVFAPPPRDD